MRGGSRVNRRWEELFWHSLRIFMNIYWLIWPLPRTTSYIDIYTYIYIYIYIQSASQSFFLTSYITCLTYVTYFTHTKYSPCLYPFQIISIIIIISLIRSFFTPIRTAWLTVCFFLSSFDKTHVLLSL
jgi:hypothetical protein